jgi:ABC-2 type transport system ATP-binding protein
MPNAIETHGLTRKFGRLEAVDALDLAVPTGSIFALVGPNGAGKTTTIKLLMNLIKPTRGSAVVLGTDSRKIDQSVLQRIGYVSENQHLLEWMTPKQLLAYCRPFYRSWDDALAKTLSAELGLDAEAPLRALSRGTRMKVALLVSLAFRPELVILDEPFTGLDPLVREELIRALLELAGDRLTVLIASHDIDEIERLADWVGYMEGGRLAFAQPVASLLQRCRLVEVVSASDGPPRFQPADGSLLQGAVGRTLRFMDMGYDEATSPSEIAARYPQSTIHASPLSLREVFVALAREQRTGQLNGNRQ